MSSDRPLMAPASVEFLRFSGYFSSPSATETACRTAGKIRRLVREAINPPRWVSDGDHCHVAKWDPFHSLLLHRSCRLGPWLPRHTKAWTTGGGPFNYANFCLNNFFFPLGKNNKVCRNEELLVSNL